MSRYKAALDLAARGFYVFPLRPGSKLPAIDRFTERATRDPDQIAAWWFDPVMGAERDYNIGISTSRFGDGSVSLLVLDEDNKNGKRGAESILRLELSGIELPVTAQGSTPTTGKHHIFTTPVPVANSVDKLGDGVDVRGHGGYVVAAGSSVEAGTYTMNDAPVAEAPRELIVRCGFHKERQELPSEALEGIDEDRAAARFEEWLKTAPRSVKRNGGDACAYNTACRGRDFGCSQATVLDLMLSPAWDDGCGWTAEKLGKKVAHAFKYAKGVPGNAAPELEFKPITVPADLPTRKALQRVDELPSEMDIAAEFTAENPKLRYCPQRGRWLVWNGKRCEEDDTGAVFDRIRAHCNRIGYRSRRAILAAGGKESTADRAKVIIASAKTARNVEALARADRAHAVRAEALDADPWALNTQSGLYDLRRAVLTPHSCEALCTKITAAGVGDSCPTWLAFIDELTGRSAAFAHYLQRVCGYALTGCTREHLFWILIGRGGTGKSTFIETFAAVLGSYSGTADAAVFARGAENQHPTAQAGLQGKRLVVAPELAQGSSWNEPLIKGITGGDRISARFVRQDYFEFQPVCKLAFTGNYRPHLLNIEDGLKRRLVLVPLDRKPAKVDPELRARLWEERDGILGWALEGTRLWLADGLRSNVPPEVREATEQYFLDEDDIARWLAERTESDADQFVETAALYDDWRTWANANGGWVGSLKRLSSDLIRRGYQPGKHPASRRAGFRGIRIRHAFVAPVTTP